MRIGIDAHHAAQLEGAGMPAPIEVEPPGVGIDLDRNPMLRTCSQNLLDIHVITRTPEQLASGHVSEDRGAGIGHGAQDAFGLRLAGKAETAVHARHDEIEPRQHFLVIVEGAVGQDVGFDPLEDTEARAEGTIESVD